MGVLKQKRKKKHMKRLSFIAQSKIEFLLLFIGCRKVLEKMPVLIPVFSWFKDHCYLSLELVIQMSNNQKAIIRKK